MTLVAPEIAPFVISEKPANWGDTVTATCTMLKGDSPIQIEWALNGEPISHDYPDISIATSRRVSLLTIDAVTASHAGEYTCVASNAAGGTSFTATLAVNGTIRVPYPPRFALFFSMHARHSARQHPTASHSCHRHQTPPPPDDPLTLRSSIRYHRHREFSPTLRYRYPAKDVPRFVSYRLLNVSAVVVTCSCARNRTIRNRRGTSELGGHRDRNMHGIEGGLPDPNRVGPERGTDLSQSLRHIDSKHQQTRQPADNRRCDSETRGRVHVLREQRSRWNKLFRISRRQWYSNTFPPHSCSFREFSI